GERLLPQPHRLVVLALGLLQEPLDVGRVDRVAVALRDLLRLLLEAGRVADLRERLGEDEARRQAVRALLDDRAHLLDRAQRIAAPEPDLGAHERRELALRLREEVDRARLLPEHEAAEPRLE